MSTEFRNFVCPKPLSKRKWNIYKSWVSRLILTAVIGRTKTIDELFAEGFDAIYIAVGAGAPVFMNIPGENLKRHLFRQ